MNIKLFLDVLDVFCAVSEQLCRQDHEMRSTGFKMRKNKTL